MGSFSASLKTIGDTRGLPATVKLEDGRLSIEAGDAEIGDWSLLDIGLEPTSKGYRLAAEGDQLIIEMPDTEQFAQELEASLPKKRKRSGLRQRRAEKETAQTVVELSRQPEPEPKVPKRRGLPGASVLTDAESLRPSKETAGIISRFRTSSPQAEDSTETKPDRKPTGDNGERQTPSGQPGGVVGLLDRAIHATERRWGPLLPEWVFNRVVFVVAVLLVAVALVFRGVTSIVLLVAGVLALMVGGASYTDDVMASKLLPGRMTPTHVLIAGVSLLAAGILFGIIA